MGAGCDEELGELLGLVDTPLDGGDEAWPEGLAGAAESGEGSCGRADEGIVDGGAKAGPEVGRLLEGGVADWGRRGRKGEYSYEVRFGVGREMEGWGGWCAQLVRGRCGDDENGGEAGDLFVLVSC